MNINPVCNQGVCSNSFRAAAYKSRIDVKNEVDGYVQSLLDRYDSELENMAEKFDTNIKFAQKKSAVYVNSGVITSRIDIKKMSHVGEFLDSVLNNLRANSEVSQKGLKKAFAKLV